MRIIRCIWLLVSSLVVSIPGFAQAADIAFFPVETTNLAPADAEAVGELLAQSYAVVSRQSVLSPARTAQSFAASAGQYEAAARNLGAPEYVRTSALAVGTRIVVQASRHGAGGQLVAQTKMTAESVEDMINVADRMARALYERTDADAVRTHHNVTLTEAHPKNRVRSEKVLGLKTGLHLPMAKRAEYSPHLSLQFNGRLELERFFVEFGAGILVPTAIDNDDDCYWDESSARCREDNHGRIGGLTSELGASVFLNDGNAAFYLGAGVIPRLTFVNDVATASVYGQIGLMFPRESSTRFYVDLRVTQAVTETRLDNNWKRYPTEPTLHLGIGW